VTPRTQGHPGHKGPPGHRDPLDTATRRTPRTQGHRGRGSAGCCSPGLQPSASTKLGKPSPRWSPEPGAPQPPAPGGVPELPPRLRSPRGAILRRFLLCSLHRLPFPRERQHSSAVLLQFHKNIHKYISISLTESKAAQAPIKHTVTSPPGAPCAGCIKHTKGGWENKAAREAGVRRRADPRPGELPGGRAAPPASELVLSPSAAFGLLLAAQAKSCALLQVHHAARRFRDGDVGFRRRDVERKVPKGAGAVRRRPPGSGGERGGGLLVS